MIEEFSLGSTVGQQGGETPNKEAASHSHLVVDRTFVSGARPRHRMPVDSTNAASALIDLGDLCHGLLNSDPDPPIVDLAELAASADSNEGLPKPSTCLPHEVCLPSDESQLLLGEQSTKADSPADDDDAHALHGPCWGGMLKGDNTRCTPGFTNGKAHFKNKFCNECRKGITVSATRIVPVRPDIQALYANSLRAGFWKKSAAALGGGEVRVANNTITCDGPWLVVYREEQPPTSQPPPWATDMPEGWVESTPDGDVMRFSVAKGTLVPVAEMGPKRPHNKLSSPKPPPDTRPGFGAGPKRQRRAPSFSDIPPSELPPGGLPPSVRRGHSTCTSLSSGNASSDGSPLHGPVNTSRLPPLIGGGHATSSEAPAPPKPLSPAQLGATLASLHEGAAALLEQALRPLSTVRTQLTPDQATELLQQLNASRAAVEVFQRLAEASPARGLG